MTNPAVASSPRPGSSTEPWLFGMLAFGLAAVLARPVFYKTDGPDLLRMLSAGELHHPWQLAYLPLLELFRRGLAAIGLQPSLILLGELFSALGAACGIAWFRAGLHRLQLPAMTARLATLLLLLNPGTLLFSRVVEFHAPLLGATGLAFWWATVQVARPTWQGMALLGACTHAAFLMHSSALFLPAWLLPFFLARRWPRGQQRRDLRLALLALAVHAAAFLLLPRLLPHCYGLYSDLHAAFSVEGSTGRPNSLDWLPSIFVQEWLWPLLPLSVLPLLALRRAGLRLELLAMALGMAPLLYICVRLLVGEPEYGAYLLPMLLPAALLTAQVL
ncbi:MAG TPA: hypothetical protein VK348_06560, partial [Planctomycetota bacterium]|nr:hypothetical protein [Planctomycetota bacterium]